MLSPQESIADLASRYQSGALTGEELTKLLGPLEQFINGFVQQLEGLVPSSLAEDEALRLRNLVISCKGFFTEALDFVRQAAATNEKILCAKALDAAGRGETLLEEILTRTA